MESPISIENRVEGPHLKVETHVSGKDYIKQWNPDPYSWVYDQVEQQLPEGELKKAFQAASRERVARKKENGSYLDPIMTEKARKYAFRGITRRSDNRPTWENEDSILDSVGTSVHTYGIEAPGPTSARNTMSGMIWDEYAFPNPNLLEGGLDTSVILVYKNEPYILPTNPGDTTVKLFQPRGPENKLKWKEIPIEEAKGKDYPTLRDIFIGQIEIHFDKAKGGIMSKLFH